MGFIESTKTLVVKLDEKFSTSTGRRPVFLEVRSSTWFITATICTAIFTDIFLYAVIVPVFPYYLVDHIGVPQSEVQHWISVLLAVYGAALLVSGPVCGILADRITYRKAPLLVGLLLLAGATVMLCLARTLPLLILGRVLQGLSASVIWVVGLALLSDTVEKEEIAMALGYVGTALSLGTLVAPLLGGIVYQRAGYYAVFAMCFGVITLDIILRITMIEKKAATTWLGPTAEPRTEEVPVTNDILMDNRANVEAGKPSQVPGATTQAMFHGHRIPPILTLLTSARMLTAIWATVCLSTLLCGLDTTLTIFLSRTFGWNSLAAGLMFLSVLTPIFFGPLLGILVDKYGSRWLSAVGFVLMVPGWALLRLVDHNSLHQKVLLGGLLALIGVGVAMALTGVMAEFSKICDVKEKEKPGLFGKNGAYAQSYSLFNTAFAAGSLIGAFWSGGVYAAAGWGTMGWSFALLCGVTAIPVLLFADGWIGKSSTHRES